MVADTIGRVETLGAESSKFVRATVFRVVSETAQCSSFDLKVSSEDRAMFGARPGQFVTLRIAIDGVTHERCYSLSNVDALGEMPRITIKRVGDIGVSAWCNENLAEGSVVDVAAPAGHFYVRPGARPLMFAAAGSGITPIFAMVRDVLHRTRRPVALLYVNRRENEAIFLTELLRLRQSHASRMILVELRNDGTTPTVEAAMAHFLEAQADADVYVCGPAAFMDRVTSAAVTAGVPADRVYTEHFALESRTEIPQAAARIGVGHPIAEADAVEKVDLRVRVGRLEGGHDDLRIKIGQTLLNALQGTVDARVGVCGGQAACGTCRISIPPRWSALLPERRRHEDRLLKALEGHAPEHRLACQIRLSTALDGIECTPAPVA